MIRSLTIQQQQEDNGSSGSTKPVLQYPQASTPLSQPLKNGIADEAAGNSTPHSSSMNNQNLHSNGTMSPINKSPLNNPPVLSFAIIESLVYEAVESNRIDFFQYARKEILFNERDALKTIIKKHASQTKEGQTRLLSRSGVGPHNPHSSHQAPQPTTSPTSRQVAQEKSSTPYESLYNESLMQLQEQNFNLHPSQYKLIFPQEYEDLLNRITERITAQVSDLTSSMIEHIFSIRTAKATRQQVKEEVIKEIGAELQRFQRKYEESRELINKMRHNFLKEINHLRAVGDRNYSQPSYSSATANRSKLSKYGHGSQQNPLHQSNQSYLQVTFFTPTEGMDEETCQIFNDHFAKMRTQFENRLTTLNAINQELSWKVALIDETKKIGNMTTEELIELTFAKEPNREILWLKIRYKFTPADLEKIAAEEFADLVSIITEKEITSQVQKITEESSFQIKDAKQKMQKELNIMRMQLMDRNEELDLVKKSKVLDIDRAKAEAYDRAERRFIENLKLKDYKYQSERNELLRQLEESRKEDTVRYNKLQVMHCLTKWRFIIQIMKMRMQKQDFESSTLDDIIKTIEAGSANMYREQVHELEEQLTQQVQQEAKLKQELEKVKFTSQEKDEKIDLLMKELESSQAECSKLKAHVDQASTENRYLVDDIEQHVRSKRALQELVDTLEQEKKELQQRIQLLRQSTQQPPQLQHAHTISPLKFQHANTLLPVGFNASAGGVQPPSIGLVDPTGYQSDASVRSQGNGGSGNGQVNGLLSANNRFNSKRYAQKQIDNMIESRKTEMEDVYGTHKLNVAIDTSDLKEFTTRWTQYKPKHFDPDFEAKERAKIKTYAENETQTDQLQNRPFSSSTQKGGEDQSINGSDTFGENHSVPPSYTKKDSMKEYPSMHQNAQNASIGGLGKWITNEEHAQLAGLRSLKTQLLMQIEEERRQTNLLRQALAESEKRFEDRQKSSLDVTSHIDGAGSMGGFRRPQSQEMSRPPLSNTTTIPCDKQEEQNDEMPEDCGSNFPGFSQEGIEINQGDLQKAMDYIQQTSKTGGFVVNKGKHKRAKSDLQVRPPPEGVYRRLWDDVSRKSRKAQELSNVIDNQRRLEWLKLLLSNNHLHLTGMDKKSYNEIIKQLTLYDELLTNSGANGHSGGLLQNLIRNSNHSANKRGSTPLPFGAPGFDINKLVELFDEEQEIQYQMAIKAWQERVQQASQEQEDFVDQPIEMPQPSVVEDVQIQKKQPKEFTGAPIQTDYVSMYITEQQPSHHPQQEEELHVDDKEIQTDYNLLDQYIQEQINQHKHQFVYETQRPQPAPYQLRLNQYMQNKHVPPSAYHAKSQQRVILQSSVGGAVVDDQGFNNLSIGTCGESILAARRRQQTQLFNNSRIRQASNHLQAAVMSQKQQRRIAQTGSQVSPKESLQPGFVLEGGNGKTDRKSVGTNLLQRPSTSGKHYQAIPTTSYPMGKLITGKSHLKQNASLTKKVSSVQLIAGVGQQQLVNSQSNLIAAFASGTFGIQPSHPQQQQDQLTSDMFTGDLRNLLINTNQQAPNAAFIQGEGSRFGYEPRVPTVTVNPHNVVNGQGVAGAGVAVSTPDISNHNNEITSDSVMAPKNASEDQMLGGGGGAETLTPLKDELIME